MENTSENTPVSGNWKKSFLTIVSGQMVSLIGTSAVQFALIWWLARETESALMLALAGFMAFLPQLVFGPFVGVWIDRLSRKKIMIVADLFIGLVATIFALLFFVAKPPYWTACLVLGIRAMGTVFHTPASQAAFAMLVPKDQLVRANGWSQFLMNGALMLGPVLGAAMYAALPMPFILLTDMAGAVVASITVAIVKIPELAKGTEKRPSFFAEIKGGVKVFLEDRRLLQVTAMAAICMIFFMPVSVFYPLMSSGFFKVSAWHASIIEIVFSFGMMAGAGVISRLTINSKLQTVHLGFFAMGLLSIFCGVLPPTITGFWVFAVLCLVLGASFNTYNIPYIAYMQETIPHAAQGRAFSLMNSLISVTMPIGLAIGGPVAELYSVSLWFFVSGVAIVAVSAVSFILYKKQTRR